LWDIEEDGDPVTSRLRIIVTGLVAQYPVGGVAWDYLQYVIGFARLGHDVYYHEDTWCWPYHPVQQTLIDDCKYSAAYLKAFFEQYSPEHASRWHYLHLHETSCGMSRADFDQVARSADLFVNVSGASAFPENLSPHCVKVFLDTDPGYNQIVLSERPSWSENVDRWCANVFAHDRHFTYAENIDSPDCLVPGVGLRWQKTHMPVVGDLWKKVAATKPTPGAPWSTVMTWNVFKGVLEYRGKEYHGKAVEFEKIIDLPKRLSRPFRLSVGGTKAPFARLSAHGWAVEDGPATTLTPRDYQNFIAASHGEISVAKNVYVGLRTGWFSCRSACYLAAGRPVVVQDTGFSRFISPGAGMLCFITADEAIDALSRIDRDYSRHSRAARDLALSYFGSDAVLAKLIDQAENPPRASVQQ
jgi:hypothetical protein